MSKLVNIGAFVVGALTSYIVTKNIVAKKYDEILKNEIKSVKKSFNERLNRELGIMAKGYEALAKEIDPPKNTMTDDDLSDSIGEKTNDDATQTIITSEQCGTQGYEYIPLTLYSDGRLVTESYTEEYNHLLEDDIVQQFVVDEDEEYLYLRDDREQADFEITKDSERYTDIIETPPHLMEDYE